MNYRWQEAMTATHFKANGHKVKPMHRGFKALSDGRATTSGRWLYPAVDANLFSGCSGSSRATGSVFASLCPNSMSGNQATAVHVQNSSGDKPIPELPPVMATVLFSSVMCTTRSSVG
jgi:hypothetical protein